MDRKTTAWKKNRKFGDIYGGRVRVKLNDNIFQRCHSLKRPAPTDELPILIQENPSRNLFFPISAAEACEAMTALPRKDYRNLTHIWCRRMKSSDFLQPEQALAEFICGSGVRVVVLYPWPKTMEMSWNRRPTSKFKNELERFGIEVRRSSTGKWKAKPTLDQLRKFYIQGLLYHEIGHHVDWYTRLWGKANRTQIEEFADQYAIHKSATATHVFNRLQKAVESE